MRVFLTAVAVLFAAGLDGGSSFLVPASQTRRAGAGPLRALARDELSAPKLFDAERFHSGSTKSFYWEQDAHTVHLYFPLAEGVGKKQVEVDSAVKTLRVRVAGEEVLPSVKLRNPVQPLDTLWVFEGDDADRCLHVELQKKDRQVNWAALCADNWDLEQRRLEELDDSENPLLDLLFPDPASAPKVKKVEEVEEGE